MLVRNRRAEVVVSESGARIRVPPIYYLLRFIAMSESDWVKQNKDLADRRVLPIDRRVDPTGYVQMWAHLKPIEGGGPLIPRIYFHDDTMRRTKKVHIGFIGPHDLMPNKTSASM